MPSNTITATTAMMINCLRFRAFFSFVALFAAEVLVLILSGSIFGVNWLSIIWCR